MMVFWVLVAALVFVGVCFILLPMLIWQRRTPFNDVQSREQMNLVLYRERLNELEDEHQSGCLEASDYALRKQDIEKQLLGDVDMTSPGLENSSRKTSFVMPVVLCVSLMVAVVSLYLRWGSSDELSLTIALNQSSAEQSMEQLTGKLERVLSRQPENYQGYYLLGRSYMTMGRFQDAAAAFKHVVSLVGDDPEPLSQYAQALFLAQNHRITPQLEGLVERTLAVQSNNVTALGLKGIASFENKRFGDAINVWSSLLAVTETPESRSALELGIAKARMMLEQEKPVTVDIATPAFSGLTVRVALSDELKRLPASTRVFIFARASDGPAMPLAVVPVTIGDLPKTVLLNDAMAMMPALKLSGFSKVDVIARVSKSGDVSTSDYEASVKGVEVSSRKRVELELVGEAG
ncbi:MAG: c-type cytochrome biogenesis protein CcmI [Endozoicomonadaceae bacterium]|nr:c-type cytochrome biogenesis protein CcmI [Endozoicomonadaceae bacterium]